MNVALAEQTEVKMNQPNLAHILDDDQVVEEPVAETPPSPKRRAWSLPVLIVAIACAGGAYYAYTQYAANNPSNAHPSESTGGKTGFGGAMANDGATPGGGAPAAIIATVPVEVVSRNDILRLTGNLAADERSAVASNTSGIAAEVLVDRGSRVRKGDVLVQIDPTDAKNKLAEGQAMLDEIKARLGLLDGNLKTFNPEDQPEVRLAKASADLALSNLKRAKELKTKRVLSEEVYDQTATEYELAHQRYRQSLFLIKQAYAACRTAMAKMAILEKAVADTAIRAPFDGWVAERLVSVGEQVSSGMQATKVVTLVRIDPLRLLLTVPQQNIASIELGQRVFFHVDSFPNRTFEAKVKFIAPVVNETRSMLVEALARNPDATLRPGMFVTAEVQLGNEQPSIFAPITAVRKNGEVGRVFVVRDGLARETVVAFGERVGNKIEIRTGLTGNEILVANPDSVKDGDKVGQ